MDKEVTWQEYFNLDKAGKIMLIGDNMPHDKKYVILSPDKQFILDTWDTFLYILNNCMHECDLPPKYLVRSLFETDRITTITEFKKGE